uniref:ATP-binding protein n=1 Tax=Marinobacterium profundum TaxID=1714300 RepID=UPI000A4B2E1B
MATPELGSIGQLVEKSTQSVMWLAGKVYEKNWVTLLVLCTVVVAGLFNPVSLKKFYSLVTGLILPEDFLPEWYPIAFGVVVGAFFFSALIVAVRARAREHKSGRPPPDLSERSAIKGLWSFSYEDADVFKRLGRADSLRECLDTLTDPEFRFGVLSGESGCGKTSFGQAGLWPGLESRGFRCIYAKLTERDTVDRIRQAFVQQRLLSQEQVSDLDFAGLLNAAVRLDTQSSGSAGVVLVLDQFEQFFVHQRLKEDRRPLLDALAAWYHQPPGHHVRILVSIRSDYVGRLAELQKAMGYSLGPHENFRLDKFEPRQAVEVFRVLAETEDLGFDESFVKELTELELAGHQDGLVLPVDLQVLAWIVKAQKGPGRKAFDRTTYQKLGGIESLLERFLQRALQARETEARRQAAVKVLLALVDLESNTRAGVLTLTDLKKTLSSSLKAEDIKEAVQWLSRGDVRLVTPRPQGDEQGHELAHERIIPALRRLAGEALSGADKANQLLNKRVNEWMGNQCSSRFLLSWRELGLIQKQKQYLVWGTKVTQKETLIAKSRWRRNGWLATAGAVAVFLLSLIIFYDTDSGQIWLMERALWSQTQKAENPYSLQMSALALVHRNHVEDAIDVVNRILDPRIKANALQALAKPAGQLNRTDLAVAWLEMARKTASGIEDSGAKAEVLGALAKAAGQLGRADLAVAWLETARDAASRIDYSTAKANVLGALAEAAGKLDQTGQAVAMLDSLRDTASG